jgi:DNA-binding CsgD family transcriptional regulator
MLEERAVLRAIVGRLAACDGRSAAALREVMAKAAGPQARSTALPLGTDEGTRYVAHLLPLAAAARRSGAGYPAVAAVFVHKAAMEAHCRPEVIAETYGLTRAELRVLLAIVEGGGVADTADSLGLSEATVKTHLHRVFGKTGASRQADLVKLVAGFSNPLVGAAVQARAPAPTRLGRPPVAARGAAGLRLAS